MQSLGKIAITFQMNIYCCYCWCLSIPKPCCKYISPTSSREISTLHYTKRMHLIINANNRYRKCLSSRPQTISLRGVNSLHQKESLMAVHLIKHSAPCACVVWRRKWWPHYFPLSGLWCVHVVLCALSVCAPRFILLWASDIAPLTDRERLTQSRLHKSHAAQLHRWHAHNVPRMNLLACWVHVVHKERVLNTHLEDAARAFC